MLYQNPNINFPYIVENTNRSESITHSNDYQRESDNGRDDVIREMPEASSPAADFL